MVVVVAVEGNSILVGRDGIIMIDGVASSDMGYISCEEDVVVLSSFDHDQSTKYWLPGHPYLTCRESQVKKCKQRPVRPSLFSVAHVKVLVRGAGKVTAPARDVRCALDDGELSATRHNGDMSPFHCHSASSREQILLLALPNRHWKARAWDHKTSSEYVCRG